MRAGSPWEPSQRSGDEVLWAGDDSNDSGKTPGSDWPSLEPQLTELGSHAPETEKLARQFLRIIQDFSQETASSFGWPPPASQHLEGFLHHLTEWQSSGVALPTALISWQDFLLREAARNGKRLLPPLLSFARHVEHCAQDQLLRHARGQATRVHAHQVEKSVPAVPDLFPLACQDSHMTLQANAEASLDGERFRFFAGIPMRISRSFDEYLSLRKLVDADWPVLSESDWYQDSIQEADVGMAATLRSHIGTHMRDAIAALTRTEWEDQLFHSQRPDWADSPSLKALLPMLPPAYQLAGLQLLQLAKRGGCLYLFGPSEPMRDLLLAAFFQSVWRERSCILFRTDLELADMLFDRTQRSQAINFIAFPQLMLELGKAAPGALASVLLETLHRRKALYPGDITLLIGNTTPERLRDQLLSDQKGRGESIVADFLSLFGSNCVGLYGGREPPLDRSGHRERAIQWR